MKELLERVQNFSTSRPIFKLTKEDMHDRIRIESSNPIYKFTPSSVEGDILSELVCEKYYEIFSIKTGEFTVDKLDIAQKAMEEIRRSMAVFLERNLEMKSPTQSKIYRWYYRNLPHYGDFNEAMIMVYKYMRTFCDSDMRATISEQAHVDNTIALLEAIMGKYEKQ